MIINLLYRQADEKEVQRLLPLLNAGSGSRVAEIGAGQGALVKSIAKVLGPSSKIYATEFEAEKLEELKKIIAVSALYNLEVVEAGETAQNLPENSLDGIFMRLSGNLRSFCSLIFY